jgi:ABC-type transport system involved in multi-copper enzyme maturation permease subunit
VVGPLYYYDLMRLTRRGRSTLLRCAYALALLLALFSAYQSHFRWQDFVANPLGSPATMRPQNMARLAQEFVYSILGMQTIAIFVLTPAYLASAVAEEKERGTLELLFTTHVSDREIVLGKLAARLTHLGAILLAGVPLLVLTQLWGGVEIRLLLAALAATVLNLLSVGAICMFCSVQCRSVLAAVLLSYGFTAGFVGLAMMFPCGGVTNPAGLFETFMEAAPPPAPAFPAIPRPPAPQLKLAACLVACGVYNGGVALAFVAAAVALLRPAAGLPTLSEQNRRPPPRLPRRPAPGAFPPPRKESAPAVPLGELPPVGNWPLLWKEAHHGRRAGAFASPPVILVALFAPMLAFAILMEQPTARTPVASPPRVTQQASLALATLWCLVLAVRASGGITRERDRGTLEGLLLLPVSRPALLGAKWLGPVLYSSGFGCLLVVAVGAGVVTGALHPIGAVLLFAAVAAHVAFLSSLGVLLSLVSRTTLWARVSMGLILLVFLAIPLKLLADEVRAAGRGPAVVRPPTPADPWWHLPWAEFTAETAASPVGAWWFLAFSRSDYASALAAGDPQFAGRLIVAEGGIVAYGLAARLLWTLACRRFRGEQRR